MVRFVLLVVLALGCSGCVIVDWVADPVGCGCGTHEPIFPWYPHYLWDPPGNRAPPVLASPVYPPFSPELQGPSGPVVTYPPTTSSAPPAVLVN